MGAGRNKFYGGSHCAPLAEETALALVLVLILVLVLAIRAMRLLRDHALMNVVVAALA